METTTYDLCVRDCQRCGSENMAVVSKNEEDPSWLRLECDDCGFHSDWHGEAQACADEWNERAIEDELYDVIEAQAAALAAIVADITLLTTLLAEAREIFARLDLGFPKSYEEAEIEERLHAWLAAHTEEVAT